MRKQILIFFILFFSFLPVHSVDLPNDLKEFLKKNYPGIQFRIDNSFEINKELFIPLIPSITKSVSKIGILYSLPDLDTKKQPRMFLFTNRWIFVKLIKEDDIQTILNLNEIPEKYRDLLITAKFPKDLVVPENFYIQDELKSTIGELPIKVKGQQIKSNKKEIETTTESSKNSNIKTEKTMDKITTSQNLYSKDIEGILYLTSPDTGKIVYLDLGKPEMINHIETPGAPWEVTYDKSSKTIFVSDFAKDKIYNLKLMENSILSDIKLQAMSSPRDITLSEDGSLIYVIESLSSDFAIYKTKEHEPFIKRNLPLNPTSFSFLKDRNLIAITCPSTNSVVFLKSDDLNIINKIMVDGGPENITSDKNKYFFIANRNNNSISFIDIDTQNIAKTLQVGEKPLAFAYDAQKKILYTVNGKSNDITIIDPSTTMVLDTIQIPPETQFPGDIELTKNGQWLVVTSETTNTISIIDLVLKRVALKLDVGATTHAALIVDR